MDGLPFAAMVLLAGWFCRGRHMVTAMMLCTLFGATAAFSLPGGAPITPAVLMLPFLLAHAFAERGLGRSCEVVQSPDDAGFWLAMLVLWGVLSAMFLPLVFGGATLVRGTDRNVMAGVQLMPLRPFSTNLTQTAYALGSLAAFVALRALLAERGRLAHFATAVLWLAVANCVAAAVNMAELYLGVPSVLEYVRNAGYAILVGGEIGGLLRISGTFAETSTFSAYTLPLFVFCASLWHDGFRTRFSATMAALLLMLLLGSTSSTAYAGLAVLAACLAGAALWRAFFTSRGAHVGVIAVMAWLTGVAICLALLLRPEIVDRVVDYMQLTLVRKLDSASAMERGSWNTQAWQNFLDTWGVGTGLGSARASSYPLVIASNLGVPGLLLLGMFLWRVFGVGQLPYHSVDPVVRASRRAVLAALIAASISGVVFDLGLAFYAFAAAATTLFVPVLRPTLVGDRHVLA